MTVRLIQFLAIVLVAICLIPGGAHLFELPNKIVMDQQAYMSAQRIYDGWALFGVALIAALVAIAGLAVFSRPQRTPFLFAIAGLVLMLASLAGFFAVVFPMNQLTSNWTVTPENFEAVRAQWEYGHAADAVLTFLALIAIVISALAWRQPAHS